MGFKDNHSFGKRITQSQNVMIKFPQRIPCIIEKNKNSEIALADKIKFLVPGDLTMGQLIHVIRKRINLSPEKAIFLLVNNMIPPSTSLVSHIYNEHKDEDKFLYIVYSGENTFGTRVMTNY
jgi:GABA(A) receptor-associated protein